MSRNNGNDVLYDGLTREEWKARLREYGVNYEPTLHKPSRFDKYLGRNKPSTAAEE